MNGELNKAEEAWQNYSRIKKAWKWYFLKRKIGVFLTYFLSLIFTFFFAYILLTLPAQIVRIKFYFKKPEPKAVKEMAKEATKKELFLPEISEKPIPLEEKPKETTLFLNNFLFIPKINVSTPIIWNSEPDEKTMLENLRHGVVHYKNTALPDEIGNVFITGHSSYYFWDPGKYKTVFALLDKLEKNDQIALNYENKTYQYKVSDKFVVKPHQVEVLKPTKEPVLSLMTCVPLGTNLKRLIIRADQIEVKAFEVKKEKVLKYPKKDSEILELLFKAINF